MLSVQVNMWIHEFHIIMAILCYEYMHYTYRYCRVALIWWKKYYYCIIIIISEGSFICPYKNKIFAIDSPKQFGSNGTLLITVTFGGKFAV